MLTGHCRGRHFRLHVTFRDERTEGRIVVLGEIDGPLTDEGDECRQFWITRRTTTSRPFQWPSTTACRHCTYDNRKLVGVLAARDRTIRGRRP